MSKVSLRDTERNIRSQKISSSKKSQLLKAAREGAKAGYLNTKAQDQLASKFHSGLGMRDSKQFRGQIMGKPGVGMNNTQNSVPKKKVGLFSALFGGGKNKVDPSNLKGSYAQKRNDTNLSGKTGRF